jgi:Protein of unknown function (DUF2815)
MEMKPNPRRLRTPPFRLSFPILPPMPPRKDEDTGRETYGITMLFPPKTDMEPFRKALKEAMIAKFGPDQKQWPKIKQTPDLVIKDFGKYNREAKTPLAGDWDGWIMIRANAAVGPTIRPPHVVGATMDANGQFPVINDLREIYGGRWARATLDAYHFNVGKNNGITFGLSNVQLLKHDSPFSGARPRPEADFDNAPAEWSGEGDAFEKEEDKSAPSGW